MNKRQKKKQYKKIHGVNPPSLKEVCLLIDRLPNIVSEIADGLKNALKRSFEITIETKQIIKEMSEDEFANFIEGLDDDEKKKAAIWIRGKK